MNTKKEGGKEMALRYLNDVGEKFVRTDRKEMVQGITKACGRVVVGETITYRQNLIDGVSNVELLKGCGCDMVLINHYDMDMPMMPGLASSKEGIEKFFSLWNESGSRGAVPDPSVVEGEFQDYFLESLGFGRTLADVRRLAGIQVGIVLLCMEDNGKIPPALLANEENARRAVEHGANFISLICSSEVPTEELVKHIKAVRRGFGEHGLVKAGKMQAGGFVFQGKAEEYMTEKEIREIAESGADVLIMPGPGTAQGFTVEIVKRWIDLAHENGILAETAVAASLEGADPETIKRFAADGKMAGADLQQIGDSVYGGVSSPENILAFSQAIKGVRHTLRRIALSPVRGGSKCEAFFRASDDMPTNEGEPL